MRLSEKSQTGLAKIMGSLYGLLAKNIFDYLLSFSRGISKIINNIIRKCVTNNFMQTVRGVPGKPHGARRIITKKKICINFIICAIHHFKIVAPLVLHIVSNSKCICYVVPNFCCMIFPEKIIKASINYSVPKNPQKHLLKSSRSEILAIQIKPRAHPY